MSVGTKNAHRDSVSCPWALTSDKVSGMFRLSSGLGVVSCWLCSEQPFTFVFGWRFTIEESNQSIHSALPCVTSVLNLEPICQHTSVHACTPKC